MIYLRWMGGLWASLVNQWGMTLTEHSEGMKILGLDPNSPSIDIRISMQILYFIWYFQHKGFQPNFKLVPSTFAPSEAVPKSAMYDRKNPFSAVLRENPELLRNQQANEKRSTRKIVLEIGEGNVDYKVGDHLAVIPANSPELVQVFSCWFIERV